MLSPGRSDRVARAAKLGGGVACCGVSHRCSAALFPACGRGWKYLPMTMAGWRAAGWTASLGTPWNILRPPEPHINMPDWVNVSWYADVGFRAPHRRIHVGVRRGAAGVPKERPAAVGAVQLLDVGPVLAPQAAAHRAGQLRHRKQRHPEVIRAM